VALIGANGVGKSTLLKVVTGKLAAEGGQYEWGHAAQVGYFAQDHHELLNEPKQTPLNFVWEACPAEPTNYVRGQLGRMLFSGDDVDKKVTQLSGGEAARVVFARLAVEKPNVLVVDEPTNHLDLETIDALTRALDKYDGTLLFVSHDRHFVNLLATRIIELKSDGIVDFHGTYDEYIERDGDDHLDVDEVALRAKKNKRHAAKNKLSWEERKRLKNRLNALPKRRDQIVQEIEALEAKRNEITGRYAEPNFYIDTPNSEIEKLEKEKSRLDRRIADQMKDWETVEAELAELSGQAQAE
jgi:ABC-type multidrug transport system ATPase subunit